MKKNLVLMLVIVIGLIGSAHVLAQESAGLVPGTAVQDEQNLMVRIRFEIADGEMVRYSEQDGIMIYPQTVLTMLSPMMLLGARSTVIYQNKEMIPAVRLNWDLRLGLAVLALIRPLPVNNLDLDTLLSDTDASDKGFFVLSSTGIVDIAAQKDDAQINGGDVLVDSCGRLSAVILKDASGRLPGVIPQEGVREFLDSFKEGPPIPRLPKPKETGETEKGIHEI